MTRALLLAAGNMTRWDNHLGVPKHLIPIQGEPLIHRLQRQLRDRGVQDIHVVCQTERADAYLARGSHHAPPLWPNRDHHQHETSRHLWHPDDPTLIVYGDTYLTDYLADTITTDPGDPWHVYGRFGRSAYTGRPYGEMFAWVIAPPHHRAIDAATAQALNARAHDTGIRLLGWEVYRAATGLSLTAHQREDIHWVEWDDQSDDFDYPDDWERWRELNPHLA